MNSIDTHDVELAFDELMRELSKLKDLNNLVDAYKDNIDSLSSKVKVLTELIESFYNSAKEHEDQVNNLYKSYVDKAEDISVVHLPLTEDKIQKNWAEEYGFQCYFSYPGHTCLFRFGILDIFCLKYGTSRYYFFDRVVSFGK